MNCTPTRWTDWSEVILWWVHGGVLEKPSYFSWKPCDETNQEVGIQMLCVCACVCVIHVSRLGLPASLPCDEFSLVVVLVCSLPVFSTLCLFLFGPFFFHSALGTLSQNLLHLCCWAVGWTFLTPWLSFWHCVCFCQLVWSQWCVLLSLDAERCSTSWTLTGNKCNTTDLSSRFKG